MMRSNEHQTAPQALPRASALSGRTGPESEAPGPLHPAPSNAPCPGRPQVGDKLPSVQLDELGNDGPSKVSLEEVFKGKKGVLFGVPGAYTPGCSKTCVCPCPAACRFPVARCSPCAGHAALSRVTHCSSCAGHARLSRI